MIIGKFSIHISGCFLMMILLDACMSSKAIPLPADFWSRERLNIGVALAELSEPSVKTGLTVFGRPLPYGNILAGGSEPYDEGGEYGDPGEVRNEYGNQGKQLESRQYGSSAKGFPAPSAETGTLEEKLGALDAKLPMAVQELFVKSLSRAGWHAVPVPGDVGDDHRRVKGFGEYDALIIIDCRRYGVYCPAPRSGRTLTSVNTDMQARMIELPSGRVIWQSPRIRKKTLVPCRCENADCFPMIRSALENVVDSTGRDLITDLFKSRPEDISGRESKRPGCFGESTNFAGRHVQGREMRKG